MTSKETNTINNIISLLPDSLQDIYQEIAEYVINLGYTPVIKGVRKDYCEFTNKKLKKTIMKINSDPKHLFIAIKFFALREYKGLFTKVLEERYKYWLKLGHEPRCYKCGTCDGTEGYEITLDNGEKGFLCGYGLIPITMFSKENIEEIKNALKVQNEYYLKNA